MFFSGLSQSIRICAFARQSNCSSLDWLRRERGHLPLPVAADAAEE
jgi:hypothetical protein